MAISRKSLIAIAAAGLMLGACATGPDYGDTHPYYDEGYGYGPRYSYAPGPYYEPGPYVAPSVSLGFGWTQYDNHYHGRHWRDEEHH